jgi:diaminobutyrate-2-oxoglutarate transaminase
VRGRGLMQALVFEEEGLAQEVSREAFEHGLIIETCGPRDEALKLLPPLTISPQEVEEGISILAESLSAVKEGQEVALAIR